MSYFTIKPLSPVSTTKLNKKKKEKNWYSLQRTGKGTTLIFYGLLLTVRTYGHDLVTFYETWLKDDVYIPGYVNEFKKWR